MSLPIPRDMAQKDACCEIPYIQRLLDKAWEVKNRLNLQLSHIAQGFGKGGIFNSEDAKHFSSFVKAMDTELLSLHTLYKEAEDAFNLWGHDCGFQLKDVQELQSMADEIRWEMTYLPGYDERLTSAIANGKGEAVGSEVFTQEEGGRLISLFDRVLKYEGIKRKIQSIASSLQGKREAAKGEMKKGEKVEKVEKVEKAQQVQVGGEKEKLGKDVGGGMEANVQTIPQ